MESENHKIVKGFISDYESDQIINWMNGLAPESIEPNIHLSALSKVVNGKAAIFDISDTEQSNYITNFQAVTRIEKRGLPVFLEEIIDRVADRLSLPKEHLFLQAVDMRKGGKINPHYDAAIDGYINYKCNISVLSEDYEIFIGDSVAKIQQRDLYCFEASLYKHWTNPFDSRRVFLSIGFIVPYSTMNRDDNDPRVRMSKRISKYFQNIQNI